MREQFYSPETSGFCKDGTLVIERYSHNGELVNESRWEINCTPQTPCDNCQDYRYVLRPPGQA